MTKFCRLCDPLPLPGPAPRHFVLKVSHFHGQYTVRPSIRNQQLLSLGKACGTNALRNEM